MYLFQIQLVSKQNFKMENKEHLYNEQHNALICYKKNLCASRKFTLGKLFW